MTDIERVSEETIKRARQTDMIVLAGRYTALSERGKERSGPCPKCRGEDRFHCTEEWWFCRVCGPKAKSGEPKKGNAIDFIVWLLGRDFREAVEMLTGDTLPKRAPVQAAGRQQHQQPEDWRLKAETTLKRAQYALWNKDGAAGQAYLERRGLQPGTWLAFGLGFKADAAAPGTEGKVRAPAIVLPWYAGGRLIALRYRFLQLQGNDKITSEAGSRFADRLFGGQAMAGPDKVSTLLICEGEINAMSCWQVAHAAGLDVLSMGSQKTEIPHRAIDYARSYERCLVWADRAEITASLLSLLPGAYGVRSLEGPNGKMDANDMLCQGRLGGFLTLARIDGAQSVGELRMLLVDLVEAAGNLAGIDEGTAQVAMSLADRLGKSIKLEQLEPDRWVWAKGN